MVATAKKRSPRHRLLLDAETSVRMAGIRQKDTSAETLVRKILSRLGHAFRTRNRDLPGSPDVANRSRSWAVFVHGCFWHRHSGCSRTTTPKRNRAFWEEKFEQNVARDRRAVAALRRLGYVVVVVWEYDVLKRPDRVAARLGKRLVRVPRSESRRAGRLAGS